MAAATGPAERAAGTTTSAPAAQAPGSYPSAAALMNALHAVVTPELIAIDAFVTLSLLRVDCQARTVTWVNAGHTPTLLAQGQQVQGGEIARSESVRHVIEYSVIAAHRHVFGVFFWYAVLSVVGLGPVGAVVYRLAEYVSRRWTRQAQTDGSLSAALAHVAQQAWQVLDWLPARATALGFAIVGSFEDAMDGWRHHAQKFPQDNNGVILAATAGAINVQLGGARLGRLAEGDGLDLEETDAGASTPGRPAELGHLASVVGLVWRSVIMWLVLVALLTMANLLG